MSLYSFLFGLFCLFVLFLLWLEIKRPPPPAAPGYAAPAMSETAKIILRLMPSGPPVRARSLALASNVPVAGVLAAQRELRALGLAEYGPAANDNGKFAGSGYGLTPAGAEVQRQLAAAA